MSKVCIETKNRMLKSDYIKRLHEQKGSEIEARVIEPDHFGYRSHLHPLQVCILATGWKAKILKFLFRIPDCNFTGTSIEYWPLKELLKK